MEILILARDELRVYGNAALWRQPISPLDALTGGKSAKLAPDLSFLARNTHILLKFYYATLAKGLYYELRLLQDFTSQRMLRNI